MKHFGHAKQGPGLGEARGRAWTHAQQRVRSLAATGFRKLIRNGWLLISWEGVLGLVVDSTQVPPWAGVLSLGIAGVVCCCVPDLGRVWRQGSTRARCWVALSAMTVLQALITTSLQHQLASQLWPEVLATAEPGLLRSVILQTLGFAALAAPGLCVLLAGFWRVMGPKVTALWREMDRTERVGMALIALGLAGIVSWAYSQANISEMPFDAIYTTDGTLAGSRPSAFTFLFHLENDFRQPLFALGALPLISPCCFVRDLLSALVPLSRGWCVAITQVLLVLIAFGWLVRCLDLRGRLARLGVVAWLSAGYATLVMCTQVDQYTVALFWLAYFLSSRREELTAWLVGFVGATGTLLTSSLLALAHLRRSDLRAWRTLLCHALYAGAALLITLLLACRMDLPGTWHTRTQLYLTYTGKTLPFAERLRLWLEFVTMNFYAPEAGPCPLLEHPSWQLTGGVSAPTLLGGTLLLGVLLAGSVLCWRERFVRVCAGWVVFSWVLLCLVGWGTVENGLILYTLYFSWAFVGLAAKLLERLLGNRLAGIASLLLAAATAWNTLPAFARMVHFLARHYPLH